jgi:peptidoglycan/LPS O-acetylase OafA/YrhL
MRRWRIAAAAASVVVSAAAGVVTNIVTDKWSVALAVLLGVLVVLGVVLQIVASAAGDDGPGGQVAKASRGATIIQAGRDVVRPSERDGRH